MRFTGDASDGRKYVKVAVPTITTNANSESYTSNKTLAFIILAKLAKFTKLALCDRSVCIMLSRAS